MPAQQLEGSIRFGSYNMLQIPTMDHASQVAEHIHAQGPLDGIALQEVANHQEILPYLEEQLGMHARYHPMASLTPRGRGANIENGIALLSPHSFVPGSEKVIVNPVNEVGFTRSPLGLLYREPSTVNRAILSAVVDEPDIDEKLRIATGHNAINTASPLHRLREDKLFADGLEQQREEGDEVHLLGRDRNAGDGSPFVRRTARLFTSAAREVGKHRVATYRPTSPWLHDRIGFPMDGISFDREVLDLVDYKIVGQNSGEPEGPSDHLLVIGEFTRKPAA
jgi:hypothetical protein